MAITLRQTDQTGATNKGASLTFAELDANFVDLLTTKLSPLQLVGDSGDVTLGQAQQAGRLVVSGGTNITTAMTEDSAGNATLTITNDTDLQGITDVVAGTGIAVSEPDSAGALTVTNSFASLVADTSPQLGGALDINSNNITGTGSVNITGTVTAQSALNAQTGTTYTTVIGDASKLVTLTNGSAITLTIPPNSAVAYAVGTKLDFAQLGAGQVTFAQGSGVTINSTPTKKIRAQYGAATCIKTATNVWLLVGDLAAS